MGGVEASERRALLGAPAGDVATAGGHGPRYREATHERGYRYMGRKHETHRRHPLVSLQLATLTAFVLLAYVLAGLSFLLAAGGTRP